MVAEGEPEELDKLLADIADEMAGLIRDTQQTTAPAAGGLTGFQIRF